MFNNIKIFVIISFVSVISIAYAIGLYYYNITTDDLVKMQREKASVISSGYLDNVWQKNHLVLARLSQLEVARWSNYREFHSFSKESHQYFRKYDLSSAVLYLGNGEAFFSNNRISDITKIANANSDENFAKLIAGTYESEINDGIIAIYIPINTKDGDLVISKANGNIEAVLKIEVDVTDKIQSINEFQLIIVAGIVLLFCLLLIFMVFFSKRAESIISKQHELNLELTAAAASAEAENRDKSMFLANISHELRTPLNAIIGFSDILSNDLEGNIELKHKEYLRDINSSGKHLLSLINDILEYSKAEAGKLEVELSEIDAVKMVKNTIRLMIPRADEGQVTMQEELPKQSFVLQTDAKKLKQILLNLLSNSVKFTPPNGKVKVTAWHDVGRDRAVFIVQDSGIGIAAKDISKVMSPFGQVDSELSRRYEGTGLGLPLSKRLVELLGGSFKIESEVGVGTTITLDFPLRLERHNAGS